VVENEQPRSQRRERERQRGLQMSYIDEPQNWCFEFFNEEVQAYGLEMTTRCCVGAGCGHRR